MFGGNSCELTCIGEPCTTIALLVWATLPRGLVVFEISSFFLPWIALNKEKLYAAIQLASQYVANDVWFNTCSLVD